MKRVLAVLGLVLAATAASAQPKVTTTGPAPSLTPPVATAAPLALSPNGAHALTPEDLSAYLDGLIPSTLKRTGVAGAVVVVVRDGQVIFDRGYGYADVAKKTPVDPATTLFRPGSVSKLFTWTAVMQLEEQGRLDLDKDINSYLDFRIPEAFGKPITLKNLMTHTPGFEERIKNLMTYNTKDDYSLDAAMRGGWIPNRVFPPGEIPAYSNYGASLAGYIVERVSGEPFAQYVEHHIFAPLGMQHATFEQPLPKRLAADMSQGYQTASGDPKKFELVPMAPAGALSASGLDMSHFMIAHLNNGSYNGAQILKPETAKLMHGMALQLLPGVPGMAYGFYHEDMNGHTIVGHGGDTQFFHSDLHLILDENIGLFISMNSAGFPDAKPVTSTRKEFLDGFMNRYFPGPAIKTPPALASAKVDAQKIAGLYRVSRGSQSNFLSAGDLTGQAPITANKDGTIESALSLDESGKPRKYREVSPGTWQAENSRENFVAAMKDGRVEYVLTNNFPQILTLLPVSGWDSMYWRLPALGFAVLMLALTALFWPIKAMLRWRYGQRFELTGRAAMLYRATRITAILDVAFVVGWALFLTAALSELDTFSGAHDWIIRLIQLIGLVGVIGTVAVVMNFVTALGDPGRRWWTKVTDGLVALASVIFVFFAFAYHLISISLNY